MLESSLSGEFKDFQLRLKPRFTVFKNNKAKNFASYSLEFRLKRPAPIGINIFYEPDYYLSPATVANVVDPHHKKYVSYPLHFKLIRAGMTIYFFEVGTGAYTFSPAALFSYLNAKLYFGGVGGDLHMGRLTLHPSFRISLIRASQPRPEKDWSNASYEPGLSLSIRSATLSLAGEFRKFLTENPLDTLHFRRFDSTIRARIEFKKHFKRFDFLPFVEYDQRYLPGAENQGQLTIELLKAYKRVRAGFSLQFNLISYLPGQ